jgi:hypothetical protein
MASPGSAIEASSAEVVCPHRSTVCFAVGATKIPARRHPRGLASGCFDFTTHIGVQGNRGEIRAADNLIFLAFLAGLRTRCRTELGKAA